MDIKSVTKDYVECASGGTVTAPYNGSWISAYAIALGATEIENGSWLQTLCEQLGITQPVNSSWVIALANYYGISQPVNGSWWYAIADEACNGVVGPTAEFSGLPLSLETGNDVQYTDLSTTNGGSAITNWSWQFEGGTPATSTAQNPLITYNSIGDFDVELTVTNAEGSDGELKTDYIAVTAPAFTGLLDLYPGAEVAYSAARRLSGSYTGPLVKVVKSGSAATDISYDSNNELDTTALAAYAGSDTVYVEKWYDQTGNGHHAEQTDTTKQPIIVTNGVIEDINNKVAIKFDGANDYMPLVSNVQSDVYGLATFTYNRVSGSTQVSLGDEQDNIYPVYPFNNNISYMNLGSGGNGIPIPASGQNGHNGTTLRLFNNSGASGSANQLEGWCNSNYDTGSGQGGPGNPSLYFDAYGTRQQIQYTGNKHNEFVFWRGEKTRSFSEGAHSNAGAFYNTGVYPPPPPTPLFSINPATAPTGTTVPDASGNGNDGTSTSVTHDGTYYNFAGTSGNRIEWGDIGDPLSDVTIIQWIKVADLNRRSFMFKWNDTIGGAANRSIANEQNGGNWISYVSTNGGWQGPGATVTQPGANVWAMMAYTYNASTGLQTMTVGDPITSYNSYGTGTATPTTGNPFDSASPWTFGAQPFSTSLLDPFSGSLGHVQVYTQLLTSTEIQSVWNSTKSYY
ncbi:MAG: PKD domain-containing protein [Gammaproteobacteria bacterium]|nr:PKD domain-containing protein [Gammaproteobacteria bacterium]